MQGLCVRALCWISGLRVSFVLEGRAFSIGGVMLFHLLVQKFTLGAGLGNVAVGTRRVSKTSSGILQKHGQGKASLHKAALCNAIFSVTIFSMQHSST